MTHMNNNHSLFIKLYQFFDNNLLEDFKYFLETKRYKSKMETLSSEREEATRKVRYGEIENEKEWTDKLFETLNHSHYDSHLNVSLDEIIYEICYLTKEDELPELLNILVTHNHFDFLIFLLQEQLIDYQSKQYLFVESIMDRFHYQENSIEKFHQFYDLLVEKLLKDKNDLGYIFVGKMNALMKATSKGNFEIVDKLLKYELDPCVMNEDGMKAIDYLNLFKNNTHTLLLNNKTNHQIDEVKEKLKDLENVYIEKRKLDKILNKKLNEKENSNHKKI